MFTRIVVGWDGTPESEAALEWAVARGVGTPLKIVRAIGGTATSGEYQRAGGELSTERVRLMEVAERLRAGRPDLSITTETEHGSPSSALAEELGPDTLVVVGAPATHRGSRWTVGSRLAGRHGGGTVAVIPSAPTTGARSAVVVGVDGSPASMRAVETAAAEAKRLGADLEVVHAWSIPPGWNAAYGEYVGDVEALEDMHRGVLDEAVEFARGLHSRATGRLEPGPAAEVLQRVAEGSALLVVGSHGGGNVVRFLLGSVSHELLVSLPVPLMIVGPRD
ncbi:universal stress protein [Agromyces bauzanensis]|uniref:Universal stress protein n=1 Tax=Agromyces bauzanensis TaxID=1308924 RepID=A0A917URW5_9MICO|nr:universal stress protein [Agromyces bauzanensis]GGJ80358.1 universal stress protein [Agromyces bauzanensis]